MTWRLVVRAVLLGLALAIVTRFAGHLPGDHRWVHKVGVPWLAVGFAAAVGVPRIRNGALLGMLALVVAILGYYAILGFVQGAYDRSPLGLAWLAVAAPGGAAFGALGARWSQGKERVLIAAIMTAAFAGEALLFRGFVDAKAGPYLLAAAAAMPVLLLRRPQEWVRATALAMPLVAAAVFAEAYVFLATGYMSSHLG